MFLARIYRTLTQFRAASRTLVKGEHRVKFRGYAFFYDSIYAIVNALCACACAHIKYDFSHARRVDSFQHIPNSHFELSHYIYPGAWVIRAHADSSCQISFGRISRQCTDDEQYYTRINNVTRVYIHSLSLPHLAHNSQIYYI